MRRIALIYCNVGSGIGRGVGYVAASVPAPAEVAFFNTPFALPPAWVANAVAAARPPFDFVGLSATSLYAPFAFGLAAAIRAAGGPPLLLGGLHAIIRGAAVLADCPALDYACLGEGEAFIRAFAERWGDPAALRAIPGIAYRDPAPHDPARIAATPLGPPTDLATLPPFPYRLFPVLTNERGDFSVHALRGCRYRCAYCCNGVYLDRYGRAYLRTRPLEAMERELAAVRDTYRPALVFFGDEEIFTDRAYAAALFALCRRLGLRYGVMARPESLDADTVESMAATGCGYVAIGVECGDERYRREVLYRGMSNQQIREAFSYCRAAGFLTAAFTMVGYPEGDDLPYAAPDGDAALSRSTVRLVRSLRPGIFQTTWFYPFPGTPLGDAARRDGLLDPAREGIASYHHGSVLRVHAGKPADAKAYLRGLCGPLPGD